MSATGWLSAIGWADECDLSEAAAAVVENGVVLTAEDWRSLSTQERAALTVARRAARAQTMAEAGDDLGAAAALASVDGGAGVARLMAASAGRGVAEGLKQAKAARRG